MMCAKRPEEDIIGSEAVEKFRRRRFLDASDSLLIDGKFKEARKRERIKKKKGERPLGLLLQKILPGYHRQFCAITEDSFV
jgi:hypothetical protein